MLSVEVDALDARKAEAGIAEDAGGGTGRFTRERRDLLGKVYEAVM